MRDRNKLYDVIIIGGGPAGLTAAIYAARSRQKVLVLEKSDFGGQIALTHKVLNYPGVKECSGRELSDIMKEQASDFGAELVYAKVEGVNFTEKIKSVTTSKGTYYGLGIILACGVKAREAGFHGEKEYIGRGVSYCATCDGSLFAGCKVFVIGGGVSAVEEAIFLTKYAKEVNLLVREEDFTCPKQISDKLKEYANINVFFETILKKVEGDMFIEKVELEDRKTNRTWEVCSEWNDPIGVFVFAGHTADTLWLGNAIKTDDQGYLITDAEQRTNLPGVYAAGDICVKQVRQAVTAASDGAVAAVSVENYVKEIRDELHIPSLWKEQSDSGQIFADKKVKLRLWKNGSRLSGQIEEFFSNNDRVKGKVILDVKEDSGKEDKTPILPAIEICDERGESSGIYFHCVPKGLEWNSFVMAIYHVYNNSNNNIDSELLAKISGLTEEINIKVMMSLTCPHCPGTVMAASQIAALNPHITVDIFDTNHFPALRKKFAVMMVPTVVINDRVIKQQEMTLEEIAGYVVR